MGPGNSTSWDGAPGHLRRELSRGLAPADEVAAVQRADPPAPGNAKRYTAGELAGHPDLEVHGTVTGRLPSSGSSQDRIFTRPNRDHPADTDICFERGNQANVVRLTPADRPKLLAAVGGLAPGLKELRRQAREAGLYGDGHGTALAGAIENLAVTAHAAGYALCARDYRVDGEYREDPQQVADYLETLAQDHGGEDRAAVRRVIEMLRARP